MPQFELPSEATLHAGEEKLSALAQAPHTHIHAQRQPHTPPAHPHAAPAAGTCTGLRPVDALPGRTSVKSFLTVRPAGDRLGYV